MDLVEIEITGMAITAQYGTLKTGDVLRTDVAFAKHLIEDCGAAKYTEPRQISQAECKPEPDVVAQKPKRKS